MAENTEHIEAAGYYVRYWRFVLTHLLGWDASRTNDLVEKWADTLSDQNGFLQHERPGWYVVHEFIPAEELPNLSAGERFQLEGHVEKLLYAAVPLVPTGEFKLAMQRDEFEKELRGRIDWISQRCR